MAHVPSLTTAFDTPLIVARNPARLALRAVGGALIAAIGFWMTQGGFASRRFAPETVVGIGWAVLLFGIAVIAVVALLIARRKPILLADRDGLTVQPILGVPTSVAWRDVTGWSVARVRKENRLLIELRDPAAFAQTLEGWRRMRALRQAQQGGALVSVALGDLLIEREALFAALRSRFEAANGMAPEPRVGE